jgi:hypothetical protein
VLYADFSVLTLRKELKLYPIKNIFNKYGDRLTTLIVFLVILAIYFAVNKLRQNKSLQSNKYNNQPISDSESIGDISMRLGEDVREVMERGYSENQINGVLTGKYTLDDLYKIKPDEKLE